jgi:flagellar export protein FliJ
MGTPRTFRLATVLRVRKLQEDLQAQQLATVRSERLAAQDTLRRIESEQRRMLDEAGASGQTRLEAAAVNRYFQYERHLAHLAVRKDAEIAGLRRAEEERRASLEDASKRKRIVERLEEYHQDALRGELAGLDQRASDEVALNRSDNARPRRAADG